jgi:hypothetical protein
VGQSWRWVRAGGGSELADRASSRPGRRSTGRCGPGSRATTRPSGSGGSLRSGARWGAPATIGCQHLGALLLPIEYAVMQQTVIAVTHRHIRIAGVLVVVEFVGVRSAPGFGPGPPRGNLGSPSPRWPRPQPDTSCVEGAGSADSKEMGGPSTSLTDSVRVATVGPGPGMRRPAPRVRVTSPCGCERRGDAPGPSDRSRAAYRRYTACEDRDRTGPF